MCPGCSSRLHDSRLRCRKETRTNVRATPPSFFLLCSVHDHALESLIRHGRSAGLLPYSVVVEPVKVSILFGVFPRARPEPDSNQHEWDTEYLSHVEG